jgi:hypothetical protein
MKPGLDSGDGVCYGLESAGPGLVVRNPLEWAWWLEGGTTENP